MSVKTPLLHDDELDFTSGLQGNKESISVKERSFTAELEGDGSSKRHRRTGLIAPVVLTTTVVLLTVLAVILGLKSIANEVKWILHSGGEKSAASDARLEKYQTLADTLFCSDWTDTWDYSGSQLSISNASFSLHPEANLTFFLSRGSPSFGYFDLGVERSLGGKIRVDVIAQYENTEKGRAELARSKACFAGQKDE
ncbi:hypothetical protein VKT23_007279 [Stygiomarasmius scandens]|uniref:Uncharacterized protein n=1 Tax=Marasmiellus scandens TaxID=2682957 RepID=A0ABR1JPT9_9AGAR